jgi:hypothetical protein
MLRCGKKIDMDIFIKNELSKPEKWLVEAAVSIGIDFSELIHETTSDLFTHSLKHHGNLSQHGAATISDTDFDYIPHIIKNPDYAIIGAVRKDTLLNAYAKIEKNITYLYFEEVLISRRNKSLRGKTLYKVTRQLSFDEFCRNVSRNEKTDISNARVLNRQENVQTAGGNPGGQAET